MIETRTIEEQMLQVKHFIDSCNKCIVVAGEGTLYSMLEENFLVFPGGEGDPDNSYDPKWQAQELAIDYILNRFMMNNHEVKEDKKRF